MLAFMHPPSSSPIAYLPANPSPLSPRSANITSRWPRNANTYMSEPQNHIQDRSNSENATQTPFSKRPIKRAPLQKQEDLKERRRTNFLRNVRDKRDDSRYEARGEDIMRLDFVQKRRAYEAELAMNAPSDVPETIEEDELPSWSQQGSQMQMSSQQLPEEEQEVEEFVRAEGASLEALLEFMPEEKDEEGMEVEEDLWSDDADYDALFEEVLGLESERQSTGNAANRHVAPGDSQHHVEQRQNGDDEMDMS